ncbi:MAG: GNAT family N-acetyltransferase [Peptococcaceae bacterium]|nr:GNAT family N-acetyltransferase [Peptococcaceae bacterium]
MEFKPELITLGQQAKQRAAAGRDRPVDIHIRRASPKDALEYAKNHIACWQAAYKDIISDEYLNNMNVDEMAENTQRILSEPGQYSCYYVEHSGKMIGRLVMGKCRDEDKANAGEIAAMYLLGEFWGKGYGREMMEFSLAELKRMGHEEVFLWVLEANSRARRFYEKRGFLFDGTKKEINIDTPLIGMRYSRRLEVYPKTKFSM